MAKLKLRGKDLIRLGYPEGKVIGLTIDTMLKYRKKMDKGSALQFLRELLEKPEQFEKDPVFSPVVDELRGKNNSAYQMQGLLEEKRAYEIYGPKDIEAGALHQMEIAMRLPITHSGALMADAHQGYGLPIGGVLATQQSVIPYGVGVDIGCRMCLSVFDVPPNLLVENRLKLKQLLHKHTRFGPDGFEHPHDHEVLSRTEFDLIPVVKSLKDKAYRQIGSSGSGNHFVEFGLVEIPEDSADLHLPKGRYFALLSHSGSRGLGANIARFYTRLAMDQCKLPKAAKQLAWLDLDSAEGQEYWLAMNLAGDYASACHHQIHSKMTKALGAQLLTRVENHHNFAWKERLNDGTELVVHRKGATPAGKGVLGVIPGTMSAPGFIVKGRGMPEAINSASHGAGRVMSRSKAKSIITPEDLREVLQKNGVELIGGGLDEAPMAYKNINEVMAAQAELVDILGRFIPKMVRMA